MLCAMLVMGSFDLVCTASLLPEGAICAPCGSCSHRRLVVTDKLATSCHTALVAVLRRIATRLRSGYLLLRSGVAGATKKRIIMVFGEAVDVEAKSARLYTTVGHIALEHRGAAGTTLPY